MTLSSFMMKEKIVSLADLRHNPSKTLKGFVRVVSNSHGMKTNGFFMDKAAFLELLETIEYASPLFWNELEKSVNPDASPPKRSKNASA